MITSKRLRKNVKAARRGKRKRPAFANTTSALDHGLSVDKVSRAVSGLAGTPIPRVPDVVIVPAWVGVGSGRFADGDLYISEECWQNMPQEHRDGLYRAMRVRGACGVKP